MEEKHTPKTGRRGRKPGDGVLKRLDPLDREATARKLFCGNTADDPISNMVRFYRMLVWRNAQTAAQGEKLSARVKEHSGKLLREQNEKFAREAVTALAAGNAVWFRKLARAIENVKAVEHTRLYPLHEALFFLAWQSNVNQEALSNMLPLTLAAVCDQLEKQGLRPNGQADENWQRRVRTVGKDLGVRFLPEKPGPKPKQT
jgi:hypothetical protein